MTSRANARLAGILFLSYIASGLTQLALMGRIMTGATGPAEKLARLAAHPGVAGVDTLLTLLSTFEAILLGAALYALTREVDRDLARMALLCRVAEGAVNAVSAVRSHGELGLARAAASSADGAPGAAAMAEALFQQDRGAVFVSAICFAVGSTLFAWLFLRGRSIPAWIARLGVVASVLLVVLLPAQMLGLARGLVVRLMWLPALVFEVGLAGWLIVKGVKTPYSHVEEAA